MVAIYSLPRYRVYGNESDGSAAKRSSSYNIAVDIYEEIIRLRREGRKAALATIINVRGSIPSFESAKMLVRDDGSILGTIGGGCVEAEVWQAARDIMQSEKPQTLTFNLNNNPKYDTGLVCGGTLDIFIEPVLVTDDRETYANRERFPEARDVYADEYERVMAQLAPNESSYIVIVTRGHRDDMRVLRWAAETPARYIGMIGSQRKVITTCKELEQEGIAGEKLARVYAPVGIDIGAITPEEIAIAIVAEMIALRRGSETPLPHMKSMKAAEILKQL